MSLWQAKWERMIDITQKGKHLKLIKNNVQSWSWACHRNRAAETVLAKLRIGHANYNGHLYRFNLVPSPNCICGTIETIEHILFSCPIYNRDRGELASKLSRANVALSLRNLLGGGEFDEGTQKMIADNVSYYLMKIGKLYIL